MEIPNLNTTADKKDIEVKGGGSFNAQYIPWAKTLSAIRTKAPGWMPQMVEDQNGNLIYDAPDGTCFLMIRFVHEDGTETTAIPHAIMSHNMKSMKRDLISSRDISDSFVRGACKCASAVFGYAWQLWSKDDPMSREEDEPEEKKPELVLTAKADKESPTQVPKVDDLQAQLEALK